MVVSAIMEVTTYGSIFEAGLLSSKYPLPAFSVSLPTRTDAPRFATPWTRQMKLCNVRQGKTLDVFGLTIWLKRSLRKKERTTRRCSFVTSFKVTLLSNEKWWERQMVIYPFECVDVGCFVLSSETTLVAFTICSYVFFVLQAKLLNSL